MIAVKIELSPSQNDVLLSVGRRLKQENILKERTIEELTLATLKVLIKEYPDSPNFVATYFLKRYSVESWEG